MNIKGNKGNPFAVGNVASDLHDAIVGTYCLGQCEQIEDDWEGTGGGGSNNSDSNDDGSTILDDIKDICDDLDRMFKKLLMP